MQGCNIIKSTKAKYTILLTQQSEKARDANQKLEVSLSIKYSLWNTIALITLVMKHFVIDRSPEGKYH